jgi:hypothetical protein
MLRFLIAIALAAAAMAVLSMSAASIAACDSATTTNSPDGAPPPCSQGPFAFGPGGGTAPLPGDDTTTPACSADNSTLPVIQKLPPGGRYAVGSKVNYVGTRDEQGDCKLETVCSCDYPSATTQPEPVDAGDAAAPAPSPSNGAPVWTCQ